MNTNKSIFLSQHYLAMKIANIFNEQVKSALIAMKSNKSFFPTPASLYEKDIVIERSKQIVNEKDEYFNLEKIKFNSSNAIFDKNNNNLNNTKTILNCNLINQQHLQSKNNKNHYANNVPYLNQNSPIINPINLQYNGILNNSNNNNNFNIMNKNNNNSFKFMNNSRTKLGNFLSNGSNNNLSRENLVNNTNNINIKNQNDFNKNKSFPHINTLSCVYVKNNTINNKENTFFNNNNSQINFLNYKNGSFLNTDLSENNSNSFKINHTLQEKSLLENLLMESTNLENNYSEISFSNQSYYNSVNSTTRKSSYNNMNSDNMKNENFFNAKKTIFMKRKNSRFFDNEKDKSDSLNSTNDSVNVPDFISDLISKKFSNFTFFKRYFKDDEEINYDNILMKDLDENNDWAKFLYSFGNPNFEEYNLLNKFNSA